MTIQNGRHSKCFSPKCKQNKNLVTQREVVALLSLDRLLAWGLGASLPPLTLAQSPGWLPTPNCHRERHSIRRRASRLPFLTALHLQDLLAPTDLGSNSRQTLLLVNFCRAGDVGKGGPWHRSTAQPQCCPLHCWRSRPPLRKRSLGLAGQSRISAPAAPSLLGSRKMQASTKSLL